MNLLRFFTLAIFANDRAAEAAETGFANQIAAADGKAPEWVEIPFGNHDHKNGMQVFDREAAEMIVANFQSLLGERTFGGIPWYVGHPDVPEFANKYTDKAARGWGKEMEVTATGLRMRQRWNPKGEALIANEEFKYFSPVWGCVPIPGKPRQFRPVRIKSVGFTNEPNIGVMPLSNANEANQPTNTIMDLKKLAAPLGLDPETATEESITAALTALADKKHETDETLATEKAAKEAAQTAMANEATARTAAETALANEQAARAAAETAFANERKERIDLVLADAIRTGRITEAQRGPWANELATAFDTKSVELANTKPAIHTDARTKNLGSRKETSDAAAKVVELANERMNANGEDWTTAYAATLRAHPALAAQMNTQPATA